MFEWDIDPIVFLSGFEEYTMAVMNAVYQLAVIHADRIQTYIRQHAPWEDDCMPGREYLKAQAFRDDEALEVRIEVWYDEEEYNRNCPDRAINSKDVSLAALHEFKMFSKKGDIGIIAPKGRPGTALGDLADEFWDAVRALFA